MTLDVVIYVLTALGAILTGGASYAAGRHQGRSVRPPPRFAPPPPHRDRIPTSPDDSQRLVAFGAALDRDGNPLIQASDGSGRLVRVASAEDLATLATEVHSMREESRAGRHTIMLAIKAIHETMDLTPSDPTH